MKAVENLVIRWALGLLGECAPTLGSTRMSQPAMNLQHDPFSRYGAWWAVTHEPTDNCLVLHHVRYDFGEDKILRVRPVLDGKSIPFEVENHGSHVALKASGGWARLWCADDQTLGIETSDVSLSFELQKPHLLQQEGRTLARLGTGDRQSWLLARQDAGKWDGQTLQPNRGPARIALRVGENGQTSLARLVPERQIAKAAAEWKAFLGKRPSVSPDSQVQADQAWYNIWSSFMRKQGPWKTDACLMSKSVMSWVWSWDHCFTALALAKSDFGKALNQFEQPFPFMDRDGKLPDMWKAPNKIEWYATKPPIHGWALAKLMAVHQIPRPRLERIYRNLAKWTDFWMVHRDRDGDGVPSYLVAGNDSGWDNSTLFDLGTELESPELSGYLILQMETLAKVADQLSLEKEAGRWRTRKESLRKAFYAHSWDGDRFIAKVSGSHKFDPAPTSMLPLMTIAMGDQLEPDKMAKLVAILERDFLTPFGPCTEKLDSPNYRANGYWRGPIWAPTTYLLCDGLRRAGRTALADEIAKRFCTMIREKVGGNYENFDPITGKGLCAPGYTWTSAVHLLFLNERYDR